METFGQKLREAVESLGLCLEEVAQATGFDVHHLEALGRDDYGALPDDEFVAERLRAFARLVDVDPNTVIDDYRAERARHRPGLLEMAAGHDVPDLLEVARERPAAWSPRNPWLLVLGLATVVLVVAGSLWLRTPELPMAQPLSVVEMNPPVAAVPSRESTAPGTGEPAERPTDPIAPTTRVEQGLPTGLTIPRHGVGRGVVDHELIGEARQFAEGTQVWFWTHVQGATPGQTIHHVWLHEGREVLGVPLRLGGAQWRTQSFKNLHPGSQGDWVVEARDEAGHVLARSAFGCSPRAAG